MNHYTNPSGPELGRAETEVASFLTGRLTTLDLTSAVSVELVHNANPTEATEFMLDADIAAMRAKLPLLQGRLESQEEAFNTFFRTRAERLEEHDLFNKIVEAHETVSAACDEEASAIPEPKEMTEEEQEKFHKSILQAMRKITGKDFDDTDVRKAAGVGNVRDVMARTHSDLGDTGDEEAFKEIADAKDQLDVRPGESSVRAALVASDTLPEDASYQERLDLRHQLSNAITAAEAQLLFETEAEQIEHMIKLYDALGYQTHVQCVMAMTPFVFGPLDGPIAVYSDQEAANLRNALETHSQLFGKDGEVTFPPRGYVEGITQINLEQLWSAISMDALLEPQGVSMRYRSRFVTQLQRLMEGLQPTKTIDINRLIANSLGGADMYNPILSKEKGYTAGMFSNEQRNPLRDIKSNLNTIFNNSSEKYWKQ